MVHEKLREPYRSLYDSLCPYVGSDMAFGLVLDHAIRVTERLGVPDANKDKARTDQSAPAQTDVKTFSGRDVATVQEAVNTSLAMATRIRDNFAPAIVDDQVLDAIVQLTQARNILRL